MAIPVTTRSGKGSPLTQAEMDTNLTELARSATELEEGNIAIADQAEVDALTEATKAIPPAYLQQTVETLIDDFSDSSLVEDGYYDFPGGLTLQWGVHSVSTKSFNITYPKEFTNVFTVVGWAQNNTASVGIDYSPCLKSNISNSSFQVSASTNNDKIHWIAIGRT